MLARYRELPIERPPAHAVSAVAPACSPGTALAITHEANLPQCSYRESGGVRCEHARGHRGGHGMSDALFIFLQNRWHLQGPICRTRRGPPEYVLEKDEDEDWLPL